MKKINIIFGLILLAVLIGFVSCKRSMPLKDPANAPSGNSAFISLIDVSPNLDSILNASADTFNVLFNGVKISGYTAGTSPVMTFGGIYPLAGTAIGYAAIPAGTHTIEFANGVNTLDSTVLATYPRNAAAQYLLHLYHHRLRKLSNRDSSRIFIKDSLLPVTPGFL